MDTIIFPEKPGFYERVLRSGGTRYALSIPNEYKNNAQLPLVLVLHWGGPAQPYRGSAVLNGLAIPALEPLGAIMAAPDCPDKDWMSSQSEYTLLELMDEVEAAYSVDSTRRILMGYSMGAQGTWVIGAKHQERFSTLIPISTTPPEGMVQVSWHIPLYVIHSSDDELFALKDTQKVIKELQNRDVQIELAVVEGSTHYDVNGFVKPLSESLPWIKRVWSQDWG